MDRPGTLREEVPSGDVHHNAVAFFPIALDVRSDLRDNAGEFCAPFCQFSCR